jgi:hypothetical protein
MSFAVLMHYIKGNCTKTKWIFQSEMILGEMPKEDRTNRTSEDLKTREAW